MKKCEFMDLHFKINIGNVIQYFERDLVSHNVFLDEMLNQGWEITSLNSASSHSGDLKLIVSLRKESKQAKA